MGEDGSATDRDAPQPVDTSPPPLAALFLIKFDVKVGYTIAWKRPLENVPLEGIVEYKSLPSGLHKVKEDLVYFVHESYAGLSAFANGAAGADERNARFVAVGLLVPRRDGRLGRAWLHAAELKRLARLLVRRSADTQPLEEYWSEHRSHDDVDRGEQASASQRRARTLSTATLISPAEQSLPPYHPAFSILELLDTFGPLVYPLHRETLLRRRTLLITRPPVHLPCNFVYDLSILSSLPLALTPILTIPSPSLARLRPLFALGIHDIPYLEKLRSPSPQKSTDGQPVGSSPEARETATDEGWIACTTDEILAVKPHLYDVLVELPSIHGAKWPTLKRSGSGKPIRATQRDLRRYKALRRALNPIRRLAHQGGDTEERFEDEDTDEQTHLLFKPPDPAGDAEEEGAVWPNGDEDQLAEPTSWSALAYSGFVWWASAGEKDEWQMEEEDFDQSLLRDIGALASKVAEQFRYTDELGNEPDYRASRERGAKGRRENNALLETAVIAYFHRITKQMFEASAGVIDEQAGEAELDEETDEGGDKPVEIGSAELRRMGLDVWSQADRDFVVQFASLWFQRRVEVHGLGVECCGVRIC